MNNPRVGSIAFQVCLRLALRPGSAMFTDEICDEFKSDSRVIHHRLAHAVREGWVKRDKVAGEKFFFYSAGPTLEAAMKGP